MGSLNPAPPPFVRRQSVFVLLVFVPGHRVAMFLIERPLHWVLQDVCHMAGLPPLGSEAFLLSHSCKQAQAQAEFMGPPPCPLPLLWGGTAREQPKKRNPYI